MRPFVAEHYKPEPRKKVKRNDPFAEGAFRRDPRPGIDDGARTRGARAPVTMADSAPPADRFSLRRWSQRKLAAARGGGRAGGDPGRGRAGRARSTGRARARYRGAAACPGRNASPPGSCRPSIRCASIPTSRAFLQPKVDESLQRQALKKLFARPALQRDGRARRLHRRLRQARSDCAGDRPPARAGPLSLRSAARPA